MPSFEETYHNFASLVFNLALQYVQNIEDAQEVTQDVFLAIHQSQQNFRAEAELKTWIYRIAINKSLDFLKAQRRKKRFAFFTSLFAENAEEHSGLPHHFEHPGVVLEQKEALKKIFSAINLLPENQKTALILSKLGGKNQKEVAEIMNISTKAVESLSQRAKTNLAKNISNNEGKYKQRRPI